jgi:hypothetical protein
MMSGKTNKFLYATLEAKHSYVWQQEIAFSISILLWYRYFWKETEMRALVVTYLTEVITLCVVDAYYAYGYKYCNHNYGDPYPSIQFTGFPLVVCVSKFS